MTYCDLVNVGRPFRRTFWIPQPSILPRCGVCSIAKNVNKSLTLVNYGGTDKSLARRGGKQATATKLRLLQAIQKQFRRLSVQPGFRVDQKWRPSNCFFSRVGLRTYQHPCNKYKPLTQGFSY